MFVGRLDSLILSGSGRQIIPANLKAARKVSLALSESQTGYEEAS